MTGASRKDFLVLKQKTKELETPKFLPLDAAMSGHDALNGCSRFAAIWGQQSRDGQNLAGPVLLIQENTLNYFCRAS